MIGLADGRAALVVGRAPLIFNLSLSNVKNFNRGADNDVRQRQTFIPDGTASLRSVSLEDVMFINVEGVPELSDFKNLSPSMQRFWDKASESLRKNGETAADVYPQAGLFAEFGKVACITAGVLRRREGYTQPFFVTTTFVSDDEREVLANFSEVVNNLFADNNKPHYLCGHGIWQRDMPFVAKRLLVNHMPLPSIFDNKARCPLRAQLVDTAESWTFSDHSAPRVPADLLAEVFGLDCEDSDYDVTVANDIFYTDGDIDALKARSERKALLNAQLVLRFRGEGVIDPGHVVRKA